MNSQAHKIWNGSPENLQMIQNSHVFQCIQDGRGSLEARVDQLVVERDSFEMDTDLEGANHASKE
jgi:hypothetical protein